jgi:hypothetical protein
MVAEIGVQPAAARGRVEPERRVPSWPVVRSLVPVELRKLVTNAGFLGGFGFVLVFLVLVTGGALLASEDPADDRGLARLVIGQAFGLLVATLIGTDASALRTHRGRVGELFDSLPSPRETRTTALAAAVAIGPAAAMLFLTITGLALWPGDGVAELREASFIMQVPLTALVFGALALALARWIRHLIAAPAIVVLLVMTPLIWLVPWVAPASSGIQMGWHYAYLVGSVALWLSLALAGDRRGTGGLWRALMVPGVLLVLVVASVYMQIPPGGLP